MLIFIPFLIETKNCKWFFLYAEINSHNHYAEIRDIIIVLTECVVSDPTEYNFNVDEIVAESLCSEHISERLFCNAHPPLIFNRVITRQ